MRLEKGEYLPAPSLLGVFNQAPDPLRAGKSRTTGSFANRYEANNCFRYRIRALGDYGASIARVDSKGSGKPNARSHRGAGSAAEKISA
jgi:hypothetical protein